MKAIAEYIWLDGNNLVKDEAGKFVLDPNQNPEIRSKTKIINFDAKGVVRGFRENVSLGTRQRYAEALAKDMPTWGFDGSSTNQAEGHDSDCILKPVRAYVDPLRTKERPDYLSLLVLNEVFNVPGDTPHLSNTRALLRNIAERCKAQEFWFGIEQEYTLMRVDDHDFSRLARPLGFPKEEGKFPEAQGKYYCGNGADRVVRRELIDKHMYACLDANLVIPGTNAEVMPGQWEFQMGNGTSDSDPLRVADDLVIARYLLSRIGENYGIVASLEAKPAKGDWNGAGAHTNFSTKRMRESSECFDTLIEKFRAHQKEHIAIYGVGIEERLTGKHETCPYTEFRAGVSNRGASIRIPWQTAVEQKGYMEDRRPCANMDQHVVMAKIMETYNQPIIDNLGA
ncbi:MAG: glutamine synthetase beta-grasp domain-containing protein [Nanoarchaeota archaeon]